MKRFSKIFILLALLGSAFSIAGCHSSVTMSEFEKQTREIYELGLREGYIKDQTYEEWLNSIKGKDGQTPYIGDNGNWWIGDIDTGVPATGPSGKDGKDGADGQDGKDGKDGADGQDGKDGKDGVDGIDGHDGKDGVDGQDGTDGQTPYIGENGNWWIGDIDTGIPATGPSGADGHNGADGKDGEDGADGADGISVVSTYIDENGDLIVEFSNGEIINAGHVKDVDTYTVNFYVDDDLVATRNVLSGSKVSRPTDEETAGYTISDWYYLDGSVHESWKFFGYVVTEDMDLYAEYTCNEYTVSFIDERFGYELDDVVVTYDSDYVFQQLEKTGYTHLNFVDIESKTYEISGVWRVARDITLYVQWAANSYVVSLNPNGGQVPYEILDVFYDSIYSLPVPTRTNYVFLGWFDGDVKVSNNATWKFPSNKSLIAKWTNVTNTYVLDAGDGVCDVASIVIGWEDEYSLPIPTRDGYEFWGWFLGNIPVKDSGIWTYSNSGGILTAKWADSEMVYPNISNGISYIPHNATEIPYQAYSNREELEQIFIPNSVTSIGVSAFFNCSSLASITIPNSVTSIGGGAFSNCSSLTSITIPNSVTSIPSRAFSDCSSLTSITIPNSVTSIGFCAFSDCSSLTSIVIPSSVTAIGEGAFLGCTSLVYIDVDKENITYYSDNGVLLDKDKSTLLAFPAGLSGDYAIPSSVTTISDSAFFNCSSLTSIAIPNSVTTIGVGAFSRCTSLTSIVIPSSVTTIGGSAFSRCTSLTIYCEAQSKPSGWSYDWNQCTDSTKCPVVWGYKGDE